MPSFQPLIILVICALGVWSNPPNELSSRHKDKTILSAGEMKNNKVMFEQNLDGEAGTAKSMTVTFPGDGKPFHFPIRYLSVKDNLCTKPKGCGKYARIKEGGVGSTKVELEFDLQDRKNYKFLVRLFRKE